MAAELSIRAGAAALVLLLGACGPATTMPSLKENVHARPALSHKCYRLLHLALPPTVKLIDNPDYGIFISVPVPCDPKMSGPHQF